MKYITVLIAFFLLTYTTNAQDSDLISGRWVFTKVLNEKIDEASMAYLENEVLGKWEFHFLADGKFETTMMEGQSNGSWSHDTDAKTISIIDKQGGTQEFKILKSSQDTLALNLGTGKFLLTRKE